MENKKLKFSLLTAILLCLFVSIFDADAQTSRRRKKRAVPPLVASTAVPPTIASRNEQYLDGNQIILGENPQQTTNETAPTETTVAPSDSSGEMKARIKELNSRIKKLEANKESEYDEKQRRLALNLDILTKAETRAESLRRQLFEMVEKENTIKSRLDQIDIDSRGETIDRTVAMMGSLRPEEIRDQRRKSLEAERSNLQSLLTQIQTNRATLEASVEKADMLVDKIRLKLDKEIDDALATDDENK